MLQLENPMLRIGTCSWKFDSWHPFIYSSPNVIDHLPEYAKHFSSVEIDQWLWSLFENVKLKLPSSNIAQGYSGSTPDDFLFTILVPNSITLTHFHMKVESQALKPNPNFLSVDLFKEIVKRLEPMHKKIGAFIFDFEFLHKLKMATHSKFLQHLDEFFAKMPKQWNYAVEVRNTNYVNEKMFEFLHKRNLWNVLLQGYYMPDIFELLKKFPKLTQLNTIIRLHGPDRREMETKAGDKWNKRIAPKENELEELVRWSKVFRENGKHLFISVSNHYEGSAPLTIKRIEELYAQES